MIRQFAIGASLAALVAGCGGGDASNGQAQTTNGAAAPAGNAQASMPSGPFAQVEMQMHERMMAATGANASETWARKMVEHHRGAVAMSQLLVDQGGDPQMVRMAQQTVEKQQREIGELERLVQGGIAGGSGEANPFGPAEQQMHQAMMAAGGANLSEAWARKMIVHHQGAIDMSDLLIRQGASPQVLAMVRRITQDQRGEIAHLEAMLRGEGMPAAQAPAAAAPPAAPAREQPRSAAAPAARQPVSPPKEKAAPRPAERNQAAARPATRPDPAPAPKPACTPEHAAMGHC